jgi:hypothetical protein
VTLGFIKSRRSSQNADRRIARRAEDTSELVRSQFDSVLSESPLLFPY